ncbi:MAG: hypothetical protein JSV77_02925 [Dehalococcoidales bacterium]|nr:MAG: hypothetical protein JSV77_02925 [Dehalococcoidales bacterium]
MKRQTTASPVSEVELGVVVPTSASETVVEEQAAFSPALEHSILRKRREIKPLPLVLSILGLALLLTIPMLLLLQRLQP